MRKAVVFLVGIGLFLFPVLASAQTYRGSASYERPTIFRANTTDGRRTEFSPYVGTNSAGRLYDRRTGRYVSKRDADRLKERYGNLVAGGIITNRHAWTMAEREDGTDGYSVHESVSTIGDEDNSASVKVTALGVDATSSGAIYKVRGGRGARYFARVSAALGQVDGTLRARLGDETTGVSGNATGTVCIGCGEATLSARGRVGRDGLAANATLGAGVFLGRARGSLGGRSALCGLAADGRALGDASVGLSAEASGYFTFDWKNLKFKVGGRASASLGVGAGIGGMVEIDLSMLKKDPAFVLECLKDKAVAAGRAIISGARDAGEWALTNVVSPTVTAVRDGVARAASAVGRGARDAVAWAGNGISSAWNWLTGSSNPPRSSGTTVGNSARRNRHTTRVPTRSAVVAQPTGPQGMHRGETLAHGGQR